MDTVDDDALNRVALLRSRDRSRSIDRETMTTDDEVINGDIIDGEATD